MKTYEVFFQCNGYCSSTELRATSKEDAARRAEQLPTCVRVTSVIGPIR